MSPNENLLKQDILRDHAVSLLKQRGVKIEEIAEIVYQLQIEYIDNITMEICINSINAVLDKREVQNAVITGIELDIAAEKGHLSPVLSDLLMRDEGLYGIDEVLCLAIVNVYGSIGLTNFGYVDKTKPGIIGKLNDEKSDQCNTFIDDIVGAIAAAAASRIAHSQPQLDEVNIPPKPDVNKKSH